MKTQIQSAQETSELLEDRQDAILELAVIEAICASLRSFSVPPDYEEDTLIDQLKGLVTVSMPNYRTVELCLDVQESLKVLPLGESFSKAWLDPLLTKELVSYIKGYKAWRHADFELKLLAIRPEQN